MRRAPLAAKAAIVRALKVENDAECRVNSVHLVEAEEPSALAQSARVYGCGLLSKYSCGDASDFDLRTKACAARRR
jgi:hypothetical protein